jgi:nitroreductase
MDFAEVLRQRRMVRKYADKPVPEESLRRVLQVVRRAPSAGFSQGQRLVVVTDARLRQQAGEIADTRYTKLGLDPWISRAPVHIYLGARERSYRERYPDPDDRPGRTPAAWPVPFWWYDCGGLFVLLQLAAINEGLATAIHSSIAAAELGPLAELIGLPDDVALAGLLTLGYPDSAPAVRLASHEVARKPDDELIDWRR